VRAQAPAAAPRLAAAQPLPGRRLNHHRPPDRPNVRTSTRAMTIHVGCSVAVVRGLLVTMLHSLFLCRPAYVKTGLLYISFSYFGEHVSRTQGVTNNLIANKSVANGQIHAVP
jgi:hypothetical protein